MEIMTVDYFSDIREEVVKSGISQYRRDVVEAVIERAHFIGADDWNREMVEDHSGQLSEIVDGAVPVYTGELWGVFASEKAWLEDISDFGDIEDMTTGAQWSLYRIAYDVALNVAQRISDRLEEMREDEDNED